MGKHFTQIRKKTRLSALVSAVILGVGVGVIALAALLLVSKLAGRPIPTLFYLLCAVAALVAFGITYFIFTPSDKRLAKRLDEEHSLDEKIRTMVEFRNSNDAFLVLQREDADEKLGKIRVNPWRKSHLLVSLIVLAVSVGCITCAALVPKKADLPLKEDPMSDFDKQWIIAQLSELVTTVDKSLMTESLKADSKAELESLIEFVKTHDYMSEMKSEAITTVVDINLSLYGVNTSTRIGEKLKESQNETLAELGTELVNMSGSKTKKLLEELKEELADIDSDPNFVADEINAAISQADVDSENTLVKYLLNFASALRSYSNGMADIDGTFGNLPLELSNDVMIQNINKMTTQSVISKLCEIFGITAEDLAGLEGGGDIDTRPPTDHLPGEDPDTEIRDPDTEIGSGALGDGDRVYASDDMIYNPYTNTYVSYGELLDEYNAKATDKVIDGQISAEFAKFIEEYFKSLSEYKPED